MTRAVLLTGTSVLESQTRILRAGDLEATLDAGGLRWVRWSGIEILRGLLFLVRTPGWGTASPVIEGLTVEETGEVFSVRYVAHYGPGPGALRVRITLTGEATGRLRAEALIEPQAPFETNRIGFVILHPLDGVAGRRVTVDHASGSTRDLVIPARISPGQPLMDIAAIRHRPVAGLEIETRFDGDVFEMEDHRNWSDASFKTYSRPIGLPYPYLLSPEAPASQSVTISVSGLSEEHDVRSAVEIPPSGGKVVPDYALPLDRLEDVTAALAWPQAIANLSPRWLLLRHDATREAPDADFAPLARLLARTGARLEVQAILAGSSEADADAEIEALATRFRSASVAADRIGAFAKIDEQSFQPGEARPPHPAEDAIAASLRRHFPVARHIGGTPAFFTEFNRKRPDPALWHGLSFATTPVVHAADDASVIETLEALPHILASATALAGGLPLSVGPTGIGARINPYGPAPTVNPPEERQGMAARDPRQRGLFAAAWIVGYLARIAPFAPERFAFGAPTGPFGLISTRQDHARPFWDERPDGEPYPLFQVAKILAAAAGAELLEADTRDGIARLAWRRDGRRFHLAANLTSEQRAITSLYADRPLVLVIDASALEQQAPDGAGFAPRRQDVPGTLEAYAVLYVEEEGER